MASSLVLPSGLTSSLSRTMRTRILRISTFHSKNQNLSSLSWRQPSRRKNQIPDIHDERKRDHSSSSESDISVATSQVAQQEWTYNIFEDSPYKSQMVDVSDIAQDMRLGVREYTERHENVKLVGILAQPPQSSPWSIAGAELYSDQISRIFEEDSIHYHVSRCVASSPQAVASKIQKYNQDSSVHGILVFYPIFSSQQRNDRRIYMHRATGVYFKTDDDWLRDSVHPSKDVEGLCHAYHSRGLFRQRAATGRKQCHTYIPCTAQAVSRILDRHCMSKTLEDSCLSDETRWTGCTVTIVNRSEIMGRPLAALLALKGAVVYSVDESSILEFSTGRRLRRRNDMSLEKCLERSEIIVSGVPNESFKLPSHAIRDGSFIVNVSEHLNIEEDSLFPTKPNVQLVPHVGKVTVASLEENLVRLHREQKGSA